MNDVITPDQVVLAHDVSEQICSKCTNEMYWRECWNCEDGFSDHDCGEDCCCCLDPEPNVVCDTCDGDTGWYQCPHCSPWEDD